MQKTFPTLFTMHKLNKHFFLCFIFFALSANLWSQTKQATQTVYIMIDSVQHPIHRRSIQTERKRGWDIQGISVGNRTIRYLMGKHARQITTSTPTFVIYPERLLNDYAIIRLKGHRNYRMMPAAEFKDCSYMRVELDLFNIKIIGKDGFLVTPHKPLSPGEYILVDMSQKRLNVQGDFTVYDFTVEK